MNGYGPVNMTMLEAQAATTDAHSDSHGVEPAGAAATKTVVVKTYGCQMNVYDSERMVEALAPLGYRQGEDASAADLVILNTCHIREKAAEKVYSELGRLRQTKIERAAQGLATVIAVAGCVAQAEGSEIIRREPGVDVVVGPQSYHRLPDLLRGLARGRRHAIETDFPDEDKFTSLPPRARPRAPSAFLTVQEGCDKFCTFCVVPYTRGMELSRPVAAIEAEARRLVDAGVRELTLLGQNVNGYHGTGLDGAEWSLARLVRQLARIDGLERIRYMTSHPRDMTDDLIEAHGSEPKLMPFLHLPVQSGSDRILAAMNRKHTAANYLRLIDRIRARRPDIALSTDVIVGFPGETDADFEATMSLVAAVGFAQSFSFKYSPRPGTPSASIGDAIPDGLMSQRLARLQQLFEAQLTTFNAATVGRVLPVLFEKRGRRDGQIVGRTPYLQAVHAEGPETLVGRVRDVAIEHLGHFTLSGRLVA